jgi:hypothetical protein
MCRLLSLLDCTTLLSSARRCFCPLCERKRLLTQNQGFISHFLQADNWLSNLHSLVEEDESRFEAKKNQQKERSYKKRTYWERRCRKIEKKVWIKKSHSREQNARMKKITRWWLMRLISSRFCWMNRRRLQINNSHMSKKAQNILTISRFISNEIDETNHRKITCSSSRKRHFYLVNWRRNTKLSKFRDIRLLRHYSSVENKFWTKFKRLLLTSISIRIKTFRIIAFNRITHSVNRISYAIHRILFAINSGIIISRTLSAKQTCYSRNAAIIHKIISTLINETSISWIINSKEFSQTIIFIIISIKSSRNSLITISEISQNLYSRQSHQSENLYTRQFLTSENLYIRQSEKKSIFKRSFQSSPFLKFFQSLEISKQFYR